MPIFGSSNRQDINLIPEEQQEIRQSQNKKGILVFVILVFIFVAILFAVAFIQKWVADNDSQKIAEDTKTQTAAWQKEASAAASAVSVKGRLAALKTFSSSDVAFETKLQNLASAIPARVQLVNVAIDSKGKTDLSAKAVSSAEAYECLESLKAKSDLFSSVRLSAISKKSPTEVDITISLVIN